MKRSLPFITAFVRERLIFLGIFLVGFVFYLQFSQLLPITDPVESNYALTAKEMVLASDWLSPRIYGNVWFDKPVFFYWLTAAAFKIFGFSDLAARVTPALFAAAGLVLIFWFARKLFNQTVAFWAVMVLGTSLEYLLLAKLVITDMVFFVFHSAALVFFYLGYIRMDGTKRWYLIMYVCLALAVLTKGPVGIVLPGLIILIFISIQRKWAEIGNMSIPVGLVLFSAVALPWYIAMYAMYGTEFLNNFFGVHNYLRATVSEHPKDNVIYYYVIVFLLSALPWSAFAVKAMVKEYKGARASFSPLVIFSILWVVVYFIFYSLMATKYLTYTFPMLFPVALLTAIHLDKLLVRGEEAAIGYWIGVPLALAMLGYVLVASRYIEGFRLAFAVGALLLPWLLVWWQAKRRNPRYVLGLLCLCQVASYVVLSVGVFPAIAEVRSGKVIAEGIVDDVVSQIGLYQFYSTSAVYYSGSVAVKIAPEGTKAEGQSQLLSWSSKYTMPVQPLPRLIAQSTNKNLQIVVPDKKRDEFWAEAAKYNPRLLKHTESYSYYYLRIE